MSEERSESKPSNVDYDHSLNAHTVQGAQSAWAIFFEKKAPQSVLDVGCGPGTWLCTALQNGVTDILGVDGASMSPNEMLFPREQFKQVDLTRPWNLGRKFDVVLCLEVAEHLDESSARNLIRALSEHTDTIYFSAACPGQPGQHHVNCQWPTYWQQLFNECGFACFDDLRWRIWDDVSIEPWYRQNVFSCKRDDAAGSEDRIRAVIHPQMCDRLFSLRLSGERQKWQKNLEGGNHSLGYYLRVVSLTLGNKLVRGIQRLRAKRVGED